MNHKLEDILDPTVRTSFMCIGNPLIERDRFGILFADALSRLKLPDKWQIINCETVPENFIGKLIKHEPDTVFFVDSFDGKGSLVAPMEQVRDKSFGTHKTSLQQLNEFVQNFRMTKSWFLGLGSDESTIKSINAQVIDYIIQIKTIINQNLD